MSDIFHRGAPDATQEEQRIADRNAQRRARQWIKATDRLSLNPDFAVWLYDVMDDLGLFDRPEGPIGEFGQGYRAAASRIRNRMLEAPEAVRLFIDLTKRHHGDLHKRLVADRKKHKTEN